MYPAASGGRDLCACPSVVHMRTVNSVAMPDGGSGMEHLQAYRAAVIGKRHGNKAGRMAAPLAIARRLIFAVVTLFAASVFSSASHAQAGPFAGMAGNWSGAGTVTLDGGWSEGI